MDDGPPTRRSARGREQRALEQRAQEQRVLAQARQRQEEQARARALEIQQVREIQQQPEVRQLVNRIYHRTDIDNQVERISDGHLGRDREIAASRKLSQLKQAEPDRSSRSKIEEITEIITIMVQIKLLSLKIREATATLNQNPVFDSQYLLAHNERADAERRLHTLNDRFNELIEYRPHRNPGTAEDEDTEVHREASKIGTTALDKLLDVLNNNSEYPGDITEYVKERFELFIDEYSGYDGEKKIHMKNDLEMVLNKLKSARGTANNPKNRKLIGNIVDFVMAQPDNFRDSYIRSYIHDCANAYQRAQGYERLSCVGGIVERFYLILAQYLSTICPGTLDSCLPMYRRINKALNKTAYEDNNELKNEFIKEWASEHLNDGKTKGDRKTSFVNFMQDKYKELYGEDELEEPTIKMINELANQLDYAFDSGVFGGAKRTRRKRTMKKSKKRQSRKAKKSRKSRKH